jgi:hypothetical protein
MTEYANLTKDDPDYRKTFKLWWAGPGYKRYPDIVRELKNLDEEYAIAKKKGGSTRRNTRKSLSKSRKASRK